MHSLPLTFDYSYSTESPFAMMYRNAKQESLPRMSSHLSYGEAVSSAGWLACLFWCHCACLSCLLCFTVAITIVSFTTDHFSLAFTSLPSDYHVLLAGHPELNHLLITQLVLHFFCLRLSCSFAAVLCLAYVKPLIIESFLSTLSSQLLPSSLFDCSSYLLVKSTGRARLSGGRLSASAATTLSIAHPIVLFHYSEQCEASRM